MLNKIKTNLERAATLKNIVILFGILIVFNIVIWPNVVEKMEIISGGYNLLDVRFSYSPEEAYEVISAYGESGRDFYLKISLMVDFIYPFSVALFFCFLINFIFRHSFFRKKFIQKLSFFPFIPLVVDCFENLGIIAMIKNYPEKSILIANITSQLTSLKWILIAVSIMIVLFGLIIRIFKGSIDNG